MQPSWDLLSTRGLVFCYLAVNPTHTMKQASQALNLTEWSIARAINDLEDAGLISKKRQGRANAYVVNSEGHFRHPTLSHLKLDALIETVRSA